MGHAISVKIKKGQGSRLDVSRLNRLYHSKMYAQNKKSFEIFMKQIEDVCKKTSYLSYKWAQDIHSRLQTAKDDELYSEYQSTFQENCRRDGEHEVVFHALEIRKCFLHQIGEKYNTKKSTLDLSQLKALIFQSKCYFMVMHWFHKISSLNDAKAKDLDDCQKQIFVKFMQQDSVYEQIIQVAAKTYVQYLQKEEISKILEDECDPNLASKQVLKELRNLRKCKKFHEKEKAIHKLQELLLQNEQRISQNMDLIERMVGKSKIFAHLLIIKQLGNLDVSYLWGKIYGGKYDHLLR